MALKKAVQVFGALAVVFSTSSLCWAQDAIRVDYLETKEEMIQDFCRTNPISNLKNSPCDYNGIPKMAIIYFRKLLVKPF